ncbi:MAG: DUF2911 domain-containing protein [Gemmatimonadetes bacterium]|nr:DUF2911 domain-containing protein [Gemmatimonadota bacterium]
MFGHHSSRCASLLAFFTLTSLAVVPAPTTAQIRGSERAVVSQTSDGTVVTIDYARPHTRGRTPVFGGLVPWGHVWTPGANEATVFETSKPLTLEGAEVPAGRYSVWLVPAESGPWEMVLDPNDALYHTQPPAPVDDQIRLQVSPTSVEHTEGLTWEFPAVDSRGMVLRFRWAETGLPLRIDIEPTRVLTVDGASGARLVGRYDVEMAGPPPPGAPAGAEMPPMALEVWFDDGRLLGQIEGGPPGLPNTLAFIPVAEGVFNPAWMMDGVIFETEVDMYFEFDPSGDQAGSFDVRGLEDRLMMRGERIR